MTKTQLERLCNKSQTCKACRLWKSRTRVVFGEGPANAKIMLLGEAPGAQEDKEGRPFVGRSGRFLTKTLAKSGIDRSRIYITNTVKCRPPKNRAPKTDEIETCRRLWFNKQIRLVKPRTICLLGNTAIKSIFGKPMLLKESHGKIIVKDSISFVPTFHPAAATRNRGWRRMFEEDMKKII